MDEDRPYLCAENSSGNVCLANCTFNWTISEFATRDRDQILSPAFSMGVSTEFVEWRLRLNEESVEGTRVLSLTLIHLTETPIHIAAKISILNRRNEPVKVSRLLRKTYDDTATSQLFSSVSDIGFILDKKNEVLTKKGELVIICEMTQDDKLETKKKQKIKTQLENSYAALLRDSADDKTSDSISDMINRLKEFDKFEKLIDDEHYCNTVFECSGEVFFGHRCILMARSTYFASLLKDDTQEDEPNIIEVTDIKPRVFKEVIRFIYTGRVEHDGSMAKDLMAAGEILGIDGLKSISEQKLLKTLNVDNVLDMVAAANMYKASELKKAAIKLLASHSDEIIKKLDIN
ncbi:speckle-type POZ protein-like [Trichogramma pretiosum]|uniref:speckle-type POZ protein-like n=1 Tax=Trichogramma pretiosum TaxID=7493 RepID=UPI0006C9556B|nr:speckle-type POZ protein-like [Trichogramma pretiosum]